MTFQKGHKINVGRVKAIPVFCTQCNKQLAKSPSKRGKSGLCRRCVWSRPRTEEHNKKISEALKMYERTPEHCEAISQTAKERFANPENHPRWKGGDRTYFRNKAREIMGITDPNLHVHHVDGNWRNNNLTNLMVLTKGDHSTLHNLLGRANKANKKAQEWFNLRRAIFFIFEENK